MQQAVGTHLLIKINRELQRAKSIITASGLMAAPNYEFMQYNLQYGTIISIGEEITNPDIRIGRRAIIHHLIESDNQYLVEEFSNGDQIRWLNTVSQSYSYKFYGVIAEDGEIIPLPEFVFCHPEVEPELEYEEMKFGGVPLRFATEKHGEIFVARLPEKKDEKKFTVSRIAHVAPTETVLTVGLEIMSQDFTPYPIRLLDEDYVIISREFVLSSTVQ